MNDIRKRLDQNLTAALFRLRQLGGAVAVEELPGAIGDNTPFADEVDEIQATENREISFATRERLVERVPRHRPRGLRRLPDGPRRVRAGTRPESSINDPPSLS